MIRNKRTKLRKMHTIKNIPFQYEYSRAETMCSGIFRLKDRSNSTINKHSGSIAR